MYNGRCNGCGTVTDIIRGANNCPDCIADNHNAETRHNKRNAAQRRDVDRRKTARRRYQ